MNIFINILMAIFSSETIKAVARKATASVYGGAKMSLSGSTLTLTTI